MQPSPDIRNSSAEGDDAIFAPDKLESIIDDYVENYETIYDEGSHTPSDEEKFRIKDAIMGLLADDAWDAEWGAHVDSLVASRATPSPDMLDAWRQAIKLKTLEIRQCAALWDRRGESRVGSITGITEEIDAAIDAAMLSAKDTK